MKIERALAIHRDCLMRLRDAYSAARHYCPTSAALIKASMKARAIPPGTPRWVAAELQGYDRALSDQLYQDSLVFGGYVDGVFYSCHSNREDYYQKHGIEPREYADNGRVKARGHYWIANTSKPFFLS